MRQPHVRRAARGFTLVELLVVVGIIAVLVGILLPALNRARQTATRTACEAKLSQIMLAAQMCAQEHHGFYPLVGIVPSRKPELLDDAYVQNYSYLSVTATVGGINGGSFVPRELAPLSDSLSVYMGFKNQILTPTNAGAVKNMYDSTGFLRNFLCPSQGTSFADVAAFATPTNSIVLAPQDGTNNYYEPQSYVYNEALLGWDDVYNRLRGKASLVHQPSLTMFCADGLHGGVGKEVSGGATFTLYNLYQQTKPSQPASVPVSVGNALQGTANLAGDPASFDKVRHQGKLNVAFCDGHVETRTISTANLSNVWLIAPR